MATSTIKQSVKNDKINVTLNSIFTNVMNHSHYISDRFIHVRVKAKVNTIPSDDNIAFLTLPQGMSFSDNGMTIPIYKATGEWLAFNNLIYGYVSETEIYGHKNDLQSGNWIYIELIGRIE